MRQNFNCFKQINGLFENLSMNEEKFLKTFKYQKKKDDASFHDVMFYSTYTLRNFIVNGFHG